MWKIFDHFSVFYMGWLGVVYCGFTDALKFINNSHNRTIENNLESITSSTIVCYKYLQDIEMPISSTIKH